MDIISLPAVVFEEARNCLAQYVKPIAIKCAIYVLKETGVNSRCALNGFGPESGESLRKNISQTLADL